MPWLDAEWHAAGWIEGSTIPFDPSDRGLLLGDGVFDTALVLDGRMVWQATHLHRLSEHARALDIDVDPLQLVAAVAGTLERFSGDGALRITVTRGPGPRGLAIQGGVRPTILATIAPLNTAATLFAPLVLHPAVTTRNESSPLARVKSLGYGDAVLATTAARRAGCDDALFLNGAGKIACAGAGNLFAVFGNEIVTPPLVDGVLDGVTRAVLLASAHSIGLVAVERSLLPDELAAAAALVCTSSLRLVSPVTAVGGRALATAGSAALEELIASAVYCETGRNPRMRAPGCSKTPPSFP